MRWWRSLACLASWLVLCVVMPVALAATASKPSIEVLVQAQIKEQTVGLESRQSELEKRVLEAERKSIDWWFAALAMLTTVVAALGALLPYLMGRKDKELLQSELQNARDLVASIKETKAQGEAYVDGLKTYVSGDKEQTTAATSQFRQEANKVAADPKASPIDKLYAQAVLASEVKDPTLEQVNHASELWRALSLLDPSDVNAAFNHAYWLQHKFKKLADTSVNDWQLVIEAYVRAEKLDQDAPKNHLIYNNWGVALDAQAQALFAKHDLGFAQIKWREAGQKFAQALDIEPNFYEAVNNWGAALGAEATALSAKGELPKAQEKWREAGERFDQVLRSRPQMHDAAHNWGVALSAEAKALSDQDELLHAKEKWREAGEKFAQTLHINSKDYQAAINWANALEIEVKALSDKGDLPAAQIKQQEADEKYALARRIQGHN